MISQSIWSQSQVWGMFVASVFLSKNLEFLLKKNELSSAKLSHASGVDKPIISRILSGKTTNPKVETLKPIADFFGITIDQLIGSKINLDKEHGVVVQINRLRVPIIDWKHISYWLDIKSSYNASKTIDAKTSASKDSFALTIKDNQFEPRFSINSVIIIDPSLTPKNRDYILTKSKNSDTITIEQIIFENKKTFLKTVSSKFKIREIKKLSCFGTITESHLNLSA